MLYTRWEVQIYLWNTRVLTKFTRTFRLKTSNAYYLVFLVHHESQEMFGKFSHQFLHLTVSTFQKPIFYEINLRQTALCFTTSSRRSAKPKKKGFCQHGSKHFSFLHQSKILPITAPINNMWTLKFKIQPTIGFFTAVNQCNTPLRNTKSFGSMESKGHIQML